MEAQQFLVFSHKIVSYSWNVPPRYISGLLLLSSHLIVTGISEFRLPSDAITMKKDWRYVLRCGGKLESFIWNRRTAAFCPQHLGLFLLRTLPYRTDFNICGAFSAAL